MPSVFVSYSTSDDSYVAEMESFLRAAGFDEVFNDVSALRPDERFWPGIEKGITESEALVVVITSASNTSEWVKREIEYARGLSKKIIPVWIEDCPIPPLFADRDVIDFRPRTRQERRFEISRIVKYAPVELIGREDETKLLNDAWEKVLRIEKGRPHILTFLALGGEGKTALVAKWAAELAHRDWPGCDAAFAWSFYSQGTRDLAGSSDLFLKEALAFFGDDADKAFAAGPAGAFEKGQRLARLVGQRRSILILDGLEPLQYAPASPTPGQLKDQGIAALLNGLAAFSQGLCVVTTRYSISNLRAFWPTTAVEVKLLGLSRDAGVHLLQSLGVRGSLLRNIPFHDGREQVNEFEKLVEDVTGHALTLNLLGTYLREAHAGDIRESWRVAAVAIEREFETFTEPDRTAFKERLIAALGIPPETVRIHRVVKGSCVVLLEFETKEAFLRFVAAAVNRDPRLQGFQHEWTVTDMRMVADLPAVEPSLPTRPELITKGPSPRTKIPNSMIYVIGDVLGSWYYSHTKLNTLFGGNGFPGEPPAGNCVHKSQEWLRRANSEVEEDPLELLGRVLIEFMNLDRQDTPQWKNGSRRITEVLEKNGFAFDVNGLVPIERVRAQASALVELPNPNDATPRTPNLDQRLDRQPTGVLNSSTTSAGTPMTTELKPLFISYAHEDNDNADRSRRWLDRLTQFLQPLVEQDELTICSDQDIGLGDDWHAHIQKHLNGARAAVLLVSPAFLASKYVRNSELPILLRNAKESGVKIIPVILRRCLFEETKFRYPDPKAGPEEFTLASLQASNSPTKPLSGMTEDEQDEVLLKVARALIKLTSTNPK